MEVYRRLKSARGEAPARGAEARTRLLGYRVFMIDDLLRRPRFYGEYVADGVRAVGTASVLAAAGWLGAVESALFLLVLLGLLILRALKAPAVVDAGGGAVLLVAAWSSVADLYARISWWDLAVHLAATGVLAAMAYLLLGRLHAVPDPAAPAPAVRAPRTAVVLLTTALGLGLSVLWEFGEWWGHNYVDSRINVGYDDTLGDLAAGAAGSVLAGMAMTLGVGPGSTRSDRRARPNTARASSGR